jgi:hypothetical protein
LAARDRLPDRIGIGLLTRVFPPELVDAVIEETGAREQRYRALPARLMVYLVLALWLFMRSSYGLVLEKLTAGLAWSGLSDQDWEVPRSGSITKARHRLGPLVMARLFHRTAGPLARPNTPGAWWRGLRVCSLDSSTLDVPDTPFNDAVFGRPSNNTAPGPFPQVRIMALAENGTKTLIDAAIEGYCVDERTVARRVLPSLRPDMLVLADRGFPGYHLWTDAVASGAQLVWRAAASFALPVLHVLTDGSYLSHLTARHQKGKPTPPPIPVRVIEYTVTTTNTTTNTSGNTSGESAASELFCLITTLDDPATAPAIELAQLYHQRWQIETGLGALKTEQRGSGIVLRSHQPAGVLQEIWAMFCVYQAIRELAFHAATHTNLDPARISFKHAIETARDSATRDFSPSPQQKIMEPRAPQPDQTPQPRPTPTRP